MCFLSTYVATAKSAMCLKRVLMPRAVNYFLPLSQIFRLMSVSLYFYFLTLFIFF